MTQQAQSGLSGPGRGVGIPSMSTMAPTMGRGIPTMPIGNIAPRVPVHPPSNVQMQMIRPPTTMPSNRPSTSMLNIDNLNNGQNQ
jgi:hypothetical protein